MPSYWHTNFGPDAKHGLLNSLCDENNGDKVGML